VYNVVFVIIMVVMAIAYKYNMLHARCVSLLNTMWRKMRNVVCGIVYTAL